MHIAFAKPQFLSKADVSPEVVARERTIQEARAKESGKPPEIAAKMVEAALNKFLTEITLLGQPFVKNDKQTVEKALAEKKTKLRGLPLPGGRRGHREEKQRLRRRGDGAGGSRALGRCREPKYKRILLKLSGEALMGEDTYGINRETIETIVDEIAEVAALGVEIGVVIGGGNIFRGVALGAAGMDRATADYMGMLATVMNALALQDAMRQAGLDAPRAVGAQHRAGRRALHPRQGDPLPRGRQGRDLRRRHRQSVLHHRHRRRAARQRDRRRDRPQGDQGGRRLHRRSEDASRREALPADHLRRGDRAAT